MKKIAYLLIALVIVACSSDDDNGTTNPTEDIYNFFPLTEGTYWNYDNESEQGFSRDSIYVAGTEESNGNTYSILNTQEPTTGFMTSLLSQSMVRATNTRLLLKGELSAPIADGFPEITFPLNDVALYDAEANNGTVLSEVSGEIEQTINDIPLVIEYTISSVQEDILENGYGDFYDEDVLVSKIIVNLTINAVVEIIPGNVITIPVLAPQDVITVTNYFAEEIGLINSDALIEYELEDLDAIGGDLPFPSEDSQTATQVLDTYFIED